MKSIHYIFLFLLLNLAGYAQDGNQPNRKGKMDSIRVKGKTFFILPDTSIYVKEDTIFILPDSLAVTIRKDRAARTEAFYKNLKESFAKRKITKEIYSLFFKDVNKAASTPLAQAPNNNFEDYQGKVIRDIYVKRLEPFGTSISDTTKNTKKWAYKLSNGIHTLTRERVIRNNLVIKEGDQVETELVRDAERVLRRLPYLRDARVYILPDENSEVVDILVVTRDIWNYSGSFSYDDPEDFEFGVVHNNFLGLGLEIDNDFLYNTEAKPNMGYIGNYTLNNIGRTFISAELSLANSARFDRRGFKLFRDFFTPETKYAGAIELAIERRQQNRIFEDTTLTFDVESRFQDYWLGRSFLIKSEGDSRTNFQVAVGHNDTDFLSRPEVRRDTNEVFYDRRTTLFSFGIAKQSFQRSSLILGYGRTEDIPLGYLAEVILGREENQFTTRSYVGSIVSFGKYLQRVGYLRPTVLFGSFIENRELEQGLLTLQLDYFSFLYRVRRTNFRQFIRASFTRGISRFDNEFININDENGVRGLSDTFLRGTQKAALNLETVAFTPIYFIGFRMAIYGFADFALINRTNTSLLDNELYQGYGIGLRFRNENLAFNTIQIRVGWYPNTPSGVSPFDFEFSGQQSFEIPGFSLQKPQILPFR